MRSTSTVLAVAFSTMSVLACGSGTPTGNGPPAVASVVVTPENPTLVSLGETVQLTASARDASGNTISGKTFTWSSSDVSIVTVNASGLVTAVANGTTSVKATTDGIPGSASATVAYFFTVSGSVVDDVGEGVAGVSIDFGSLGTATTGLDGTWSKSGLEGRVTITPTKANWGFSPGSVDVEEETTGLTFIGSSLSTLLEIVVQWDLFGVSGSNPSFAGAFANEVVEPTHFGTRLEYLDENAFFAQSLTRDVAEEFGLITLEVPAAARTRLFVTAVRLNDGGAGQPGQRDPIVWFGEVRDLILVEGVSTTVHMGDVVWTAPSWDFENDAVRAAYESGTMVGDKNATLGLDFFITAHLGDPPWDEFIGLNGIGGVVANTGAGRWRVNVFCRNDFVGQVHDSTCRFWLYFRSAKFNLPSIRFSVPPITTSFVVEWR